MINLYKKEKTTKYILFHSIFNYFGGEFHNTLQHIFGMYTKEKIVG